MPRLDAPRGPARGRARANLRHLGLDTRSTWLGEEVNCQKTRISFKFTAASDPQRSPPRKVSTVTSVADGGTARINAAQQACEPVVVATANSVVASVALPRSCGWPGCDSADGLEQQAGTWLCGQHVFRPNCAIGERCLCHKYGPFTTVSKGQGGRWVPRTKTNKISRFAKAGAATLGQWATLHQVTDTIRRALYDKYGQRSMG